MANVFVNVLADNRTMQLPVPASTAISIGDLCYWDNVAFAAKPITSLTTAASEALDQAQVAQNFLGVALDQRLASETDTTATRLFLLDGICDYTTYNDTFHFGNLVGATWNGGSSLVTNTVRKVTQENLAIGRVTMEPASGATKVRCRIQSRVALDLLSGARPLGGQQGVATTAAADGALTLTVNSNIIQTMTPTADRVITLPAVANSKGTVFQIVNQATSQFYLNVKNAGGTFVAIVGPQQTGYLFCDGSTWYGMVSGSGLSGNQQIASNVISSKTANYTVLATDTGSSFDNTGAAGQVNFTFPAVASSKGFFCWVYGAVDQAIQLAFPAGTLVGPNNAARTSYTSAATGNRIGVSHYVYCNGVNWFLMVDLKGLTIGTYA